MLRTLALMMVMPVVLAACDGNGESGVRVGPTVSREFDFADFDRVEISRALVVDISRSDAFRVSIDASENLLDDMLVSRRGNTLTLEFAAPSREGTLEARISMPELRALLLTEASRASLSGFRSDGGISITLSAASSVSGDLTADEVSIEASGASRAELTGSAREITIQGSGASQLSMRDFEVEVANVLLSSAASMTLTVRDEIRTAVLSGDAVLRYYGDPILGDLDTSAGGRLENR